MDRFLAVSLLVLVFALEAKAKCACQCINGRMQPICSPGDLLPPNCPMTACPMTGPTVVPIHPRNRRRPEPPCVRNKDAATVVDRGRDDVMPSAGSVACPHRDVSAVDRDGAMSGKDMH